jgi:heptosyltransferase I
VSSNPGDLAASHFTARQPASAGFEKLDRILIVRLSAMGDVINTLPAVAALRQAFPEAHIGWLVEERWADLLCAPSSARRGLRSAQRPLVDEVHSVNLKGWRSALFSLATLQHAATVWNDVRDAHYDVAIDLQGAIRSAVLARLSGARVVYGLAQPWESPASLWYSRKVLAHGRHVIEQSISVAQAVIRNHSHQFDMAMPHAQLPRDPKAEASVSHLLAQHGIGDFAILNPGAGWGAKRWPAQRYGEVALAFGAMGICTFVNYGPGEKDLFAAVRRTSADSARPFAGSISDLIALTRRARIFIGGDTGPLHLAAALSIPVVAIYGPTDPARTGPYGTRSIVFRSGESLTTHARRAEPEEGLLSIGSDAVSAAGRELLAECKQPHPQKSQDSASSS